MANKATLGAGGSRAGAAEACPVTGLIEFSAKAG